VRQALVLGWQAFEKHCNQLLGLQPTISSGSQWHDPGDGVDRRHYTATDYALMIDAKYTEASSFTVRASKMHEWVIRAQLAGKRFALPVRLMPRWADTPEDYIVVPLDDYAELLAKVRARE